MSACGAGDQPVTHGDLGAVGVDFPAVVLSELELNVYVIERVHEHCRLSGVRLLETTSRLRRPCAIKSGGTRVRADAGGSNDEIEVLERAESALRAAIDAADGRLVAARIEVYGVTRAHGVLVRNASGWSPSWAGWPLSVEASRYGSSGSTGRPARRARGRWMTTRSGLR